MRDDDEHYYRTYRNKWGEGPHLTADACIVAPDQKLCLIRRGRKPGRGLWALPGGFLNKGETFRDAAAREAVEETGICYISTPEPLGMMRLLMWHIGEVSIFDDPDRSRRGRVISGASLFLAEEASYAYQFRAADDAAAAAWVSFADVMKISPAEMFEDHHRIVTHMLRKVPELVKGRIR